MLKIRGRVDKIALISTQNVRLYGFAGEELNQVVTITPVKKYKFKILTTKITNGENIKVELEKKQKQEDSSKPAWELHIKNIKKTPGRYYDTIYLSTDSKLLPTISIRVFGNVKDKDLSKSS